MKYLLLYHVLFSSLLFIVSREFSEINLSWEKNFNKDVIVIKSYIEKIKIYLKHIDNKIDYLKSNSSDDKDNKIKCKACEKIFRYIHDLVLNNYGKSGILELPVLICHYFFNRSYDDCNGYKESVGKIIGDSLIDHYTKPEYICTYLLKVCNEEHYEIIEADEYARKLLSDKPESIKRPEIKKTGTEWKMLHLTDIHIDTKYEEGSVGNCNENLCCRKGSKVKAKEQVELSGKWGYLGLCDIPVKSFIRFVENIADNIQPDIIIWTGDNPSHAEFDPDTKEEIYTVTSLCTNLLNEKFGNKTFIYPSIGNHEVFPAHQFNPEDNQTPFKYFADLWKRWLDDESYELFSKYGYYSKKHPNSNLRIISFNILYCYTLNFYLIANPTDPNNQIEWLEKTLRQSEKDNEVVYIISHISAGDISMPTECAKRLRALYDRFSHIITGLFAGHTHYDEIRLMNEYFDSNKVSGIVYIAPSLTTYPYINPSYRVFTIDSDSTLIKDYIQYRMNIIEANNGENENPTWNAVYKASELFGVENLSSGINEINSFVKNVVNDKKNFEKMCKIFYTEGTRVKNCYEKGNEMDKYLYCRYLSNTFEDLFNCLGHKSFMKVDNGFKYYNKLEGKWYTSQPFLNKYN